MFPVAGIEHLAGGDTGSEPYKGKKGQERWQKMRENVIREWEAEQAKKGVVSTGQSETAPGHATNTATPGKETQPRTKDYDVNNTATISANEDAIHEGTGTGSKDSKLHKLKEKLFKP